MPSIASSLNPVFVRTTDWSILKLEVAVFFSPSDFSRDYSVTYKNPLYLELMLSRRR